MSTYIIRNTSTNQTMQARGKCMSDAVTRVCNLLGWSVDQLRVIKKGV
jgi:hypothetical protein